MEDTKVPFWLLTTKFTGREEDDGGSGSDEGDNSEDDGEEDEGEGEGDDDGEDTGDDPSKNSGSDSEAAALRKALREERKLRRKAERDARKAAKSKADDKEAQDLESTKQTLEEEQTRTRRLAERLRNRERDDAILTEARQLGFIDPTDALTDEIRNQVEIDQDEEDPSDIEVDLDSVKDAVKALARKKKHLIGQPNDGDRSGSKFRKKNGSDDGMDDEALKAEYPSLR